MAISARSTARRSRPLTALSEDHPVRQDLSIAGKRKGLAGERSGLYMEQIRIIREMRENDRKTGRTGQFIRPRYMVWENVVGAMSSNKGRDFAAVLEEAIRIAEPEAPDIPVPDKGWPTWGGFRDVDGRWSVAWRVLDSQWWGVPQRRRRIALVADFGGDTAWEISFERQSMSGYPAESGAPGEGSAGDFESGAGYAIPINDKATRCTGGGPTRNHDGAGNGLGIGKDGDPSPTLTAGDRHGVMCAGFKLGNSEQARSIGYAEEQAPTLNAECGGNKPAVIAFAQNQREEVRDVGGKAVSLAAEAGMHCQTFVALDMSHACDVIWDCGEVSPSLKARMGTGGNQIPLTYQMQGFGDYREGDVASSCKQRDFKDSTDLVCSVDCRNFTEGGEINGTLQAKESGGQSLNLNNTVRQNMVVRRLTPLECERLQGFPDHWTDLGEWTDSKGKRHKDADSPRYKALGNSIALPPWKWLLKRLCGNYERDATMASLFDGIGGFPLIWEQLNGRGTCLWASEIEEFPIAVTKRRFGTLEEPGDMGRFLFPCGKDKL